MSSTSADAVAEPAIRKATAAATKCVLGDSSPSHGHDGRRLYLQQTIFVFVSWAKIRQMRSRRCRDATPACSSVSKQFRRVNRVWRGKNSKPEAGRRPYAATRATGEARIDRSRPKVFSSLGRVSIILVPPYHRMSMWPAGLVERCVAVAQFSFSTEFVLARRVTNGLGWTHFHPPRLAR